MIFLILGYGIPKDILKDENYNLYLKIAFNQIFDVAKEKSATIIFSGGKTGNLPPYKRTEANEMARLFKTITNGHEKQQNWKILKEDKSISTLENLVNGYEMVERKKLAGIIYIICEKTREKRIGIIAKKIFKNKVKIISIDFDQSDNRYLPEKEIEERENKALKNYLIALSDAKKYKGHHDLCLKKFDFLKKQKPNNYTKAVRQYWKIENKI